MAVLTPGQQIDAPPDELSTTVGGPLHRMPRQSAPTVSELSTRLYAAYQVPSGSVRLAGCALEQRPIVHVAGKCEMANGQEANRRIEVFVLESGEELDAATVAELGLNDCVGATKPTQFSRELVDHFVEQARWALNERSRAMGVSLDAASVEVEILWCRHASGKLRFMIDEQAVDLPFADWAVRLQPPPFICPETSVPTFQIAATDDGRIVAAEEIAACE